MIKKIKATLLALGLFLFLASILSLLVINFSFGNIMIGGISCILMMYGLFYDQLTKVKWLTYGIIAVATFFLFMMLWIGFYGKNDNVTFQEDAVVVLGAGIRGEQVSRLLSYRLDKAVEYSCRNPTAVIVVSGGQGPQEDITEALAMERYLIDKGVEKEKIIKEDAATSTYENLLYSKMLLNELLVGPYKIAVITNDFHIFRSAMMAKKLGLSATRYHAKTEWYSIPYNYLRECAAIMKYWVFRK